MKHFSRLAPFLVCALFLISGCGIFSSIHKKSKGLVEGLGGAEDDYVKTIALDSFKISPQWSMVSTEGMFTESLSEVIAKECDDTILVISGQPEFPPHLAKVLKRFGGNADNFTLALTGQAFGINAIIMPRLMDISVDEEVKGLFWFRDTRRKAKVQTDVVVFHTGTGAKLMDKTIFYELELDESEALQIRQGGWPESLSFPDIMVGVAEMAGEMICDAMAQIPWEGYVSAVNGNQVTLPFGEANNLKVGDMLDVFDIKDIYEGAEQHRYFVPGLKSGQIKITSLSLNTAKGEVIEGGPIQPNSIVRAISN